MPGLRLSRGGDVMEFEALIKNCEFKKFNQTATEENVIDILGAIGRVGILGESILGYYACVYLLSLDFSNVKKSMIHKEAATVLSTGLNFVNDSYALGFYHVQKAMELDPDNIEYKRFALQTFAEIPDFDMDIEVRKIIARDILQKNARDDIGLKYQ